MNPKRCPGTEDGPHGRPDAGPHAGGSGPSVAKCWTYAGVGPLKARLNCFVPEAKTHGAWSSHVRKLRKLRSSTVSGAFGVRFQVRSVPTAHGGRSNGLRAWGLELLAAMLMCRGLAFLMGRPLGRCTWRTTPTASGLQPKTSPRCRTIGLESRVAALRGCEALACGRFAVQGPQQGANPMEAAWKQARRAGKKLMGCCQAQAGPGWF